jgi:uncharacterized protein YcbK (DUF882 family)
MGNSSDRRSDMRLTENFTLQEFASKDGAPFPHEVVKNLAILAEQLQVIRDHFGKPIEITSGYRSPEHNAKIKGAKHSYHTKGMAADIKVQGVEPKEVAAVIKRLMDTGMIRKGGLKAYKTWSHYDWRGEYTTW